MIKMKPAKRRQLRQDARAEPTILDRNELIQFLKICAQWRINLKSVLELLDPKTPRRAKRWRRNARQNGYPIQTPNPPSWAELDPTKLEQNVVASWEAPEVVVDPEADPPTTRPRKWSELKYSSGTSMIATRGARKFCPLSDGQEYFDDDKVTEVQTDTTIIGVLEPSDIPEAEGV